MNYNSLSVGEQPFGRPSEIRKNNTEMNPREIGYVM